MWIKSALSSGLIFLSLTAPCFGQTISNTQLDCQTTYPDGSCKFGIVTIAAPAQASGTALNLMLTAVPATSAKLSVGPAPGSRPSVASAPSSTPPVATAPTLPAVYKTPAQMLALLQTGTNDFGVSLVESSRVTTTSTTLPLTNVTTLSNQTLTGSASSALSAAISAGNYSTWISNAHEVEYRAWQNLDSNLRATYDIRAGDDGSLNCDVIISNDYEFVVPVTYSYAATITHGGTTAFSATVTNHTLYQNWHTVVGLTAPDMLPDVAYLVSTNAIPPLDPSIGLLSTSIATNAAAYAGANNGPLGSSIIDMAMGGTGDRPDVGIVPGWVSNALASGDHRAYQIMMTQADLGGSIPWHYHGTYAAPKTPTLTTVDTSPTLWMDYRGCVGSAGCLPVATPSTNFTSGGGGGILQNNWSIDMAHEPDLESVPYALTGRHYYLDELQQEAEATMIEQDPNFREFNTADPSRGDYMVSAQPRGIGWNTRDVANAYFFSPDNDSLKAHFLSKLQNNLGDLVTVYITSNGGLGEFAGFGAIKGAVWGTSNACYPVKDCSGGAPANPSNYDGNSLRLWMQAITSGVMSFEGLRGIPTASAQASQMAGFMEGYETGLASNSANGYNYLSATAYTQNAVNPVGPALYTTWAGLYSGTTYACSVTGAGLGPPPAQGGAFTGSISGTTLSVSAGSSNVAVGLDIVGSGVAANTVVLSGAGSTWTVSASQTVLSEAMTANLVYQDCSINTGTGGNNSDYIAQYRYATSIMGSLKQTNDVLHSFNLAVRNLGWEFNPSNISGAYAASSKYIESLMLADGHRLLQSEITYGSSGIVTASTAHAGCVGATSSAVICADYSASVWLDVMPGQDLNPAAVEMVCGNAFQAESCYADWFRNGTDTIHIVNPSGTPAGWIAAATSDGFGGSILHPSSTITLYILGIPPASLSTAMFV